MVALKCSQDETGAYPSDPRLVPTPMAIRRWSQGEGWRTAFSAGVAQDFPSTLTHLHARLAAMGDQTLDTFDELTRPGYVPSKEDKIRLEAAKHVSVLLGLGTAGARGGRPDVAADDGRQDEDTSGMTGNQRARRQHERILARKAHSKERKHGR